MIRLLVALGALALAGCDRRKESPPPPPSGSATLPDLPDPLILDWQSLHYDLGSLGTVKATAGRADFKVTEDEQGAVHASQDPAVTSDSTGFLALDPPVLVDLDGDRHEEAVIPFELQHAQAGSVFGAFVFTLRDGNPVQLATITTPKKAAVTIEGATIKMSDGTVWRWDPATKQLVH